MRNSPLLRMIRAARIARRFCTKAAGPHAILGLPRDATAQQVKSAYYQQALVYHPDRALSAEAKREAAERFSKIGEAYSSIIGESELPNISQTTAEASHLAPQPTSGYPAWMYRWVAILERAPANLDLWLMPSYSSIIYQHLRKGELTSAMEVFDEMREEELISVSLVTHK